MKAWVLLAALAMAVMAGSAEACAGSDGEASAPAEILFIRSGVWSAGSFGTDGSPAYGFGNGFEIAIEGWGAQTHAPRSGERLATADLSALYLQNGMYAFTGRTSRLTSYVGAGFGRVDDGRWLLGNARGGAALRLRPNLLGSMEYGWTYDAGPQFSLAGIPARLKFEYHGLMVGLDHRF